MVVIFQTAHGLWALGSFAAWKFATRVQRREKLRPRSTEEKETACLKIIPWSGTNWIFLIQQQEGEISTSRLRRFMIQNSWCLQGWWDEIVAASVWKQHQNLGHLFYLVSFIPLLLTFPNGVLHIPLPLAWHSAKPSLIPKRKQGLFPIVKTRGCKAGAWGDEHRVARRGELQKLQLIFHH